MMKAHFFTSNSKLKKLICVLVFVVSLIVAVWISTYILSRPDSYRNRLGFYDADNCDVLFLGTSHMYNGIFPMELYRDYGISSWNLAYGGERLALTYYNLKDAIEYQKPKVVVIDVYAFEYGDQKNDPNQPARSHNTLDAIKDLKIKFQAVKDCIDKERWPEFFFPLYLYHDRWTDLSEESNKKRNTEREFTRGAFYLMGVADAEAPFLLDIDDYTFADNAATEYMQKIIDLCAENDIAVLMINIPYPSQDKSQRRANMARELAKKNENAEYLNMLYYTEDIGLNFSVDFADETSHLNPAGARKTTRYLGNYLKEHYMLTDYRGDSQWESDYDKYVTNVKNKYFKETTELYQYLMLMSDPDYYVRAYYADPAVWNYDIKICKLYDNIFSESFMDVKDINDVPEEYRENDLYVESEVIYEVVRRGSGEAVDVSFWDADGNRLSDK